MYYNSDFHSVKAYAGSTTGDFSFPASAWTSGATIATNCITREYPEPNAGETSTTSFLLGKGLTHVGYRGFIPHPTGLPDDINFQLTVTNTSGDASLTIDTLNVFILSHDGATVRQQILSHTLSASSATFSSVSVNHTGLTRHTTFNPDDRIGFELIYTNSGHGDLTHVMAITNVIISVYEPHDFTSGVWTSPDHQYPLDGAKVLNADRTVAASTFPATLEGNKQYYLRFGNTTDTFPPWATDVPYYLWYTYDGFTTEQRVGWGSNVRIHPYDPEQYFNYVVDQAGAANQIANHSQCGLAENGYGYYLAHDPVAAIKAYFITTDYGKTFTSGTLVNSTSYFGSHAVATAANGYGIFFYHQTNTIYYWIFNGPSTVYSGNFTATGNGGTYVCCRNGDGSNEVVIVYKSSTTLYSKAINLATGSQGSAKTVDTFTSIEDDMHAIANTTGAGMHIFFRSADAGRTHPAIYHREYNGTAWAGTSPTDVSTEIGVNYDSKFAYYWLDDSDNPHCSAATNASALTYQTVFRDTGTGWGVFSYFAFPRIPGGLRYGQLEYWDTNQRVNVFRTSYTTQSDLGHYNIGTLADFKCVRFQDKQHGFHFNGSTGTVGERFRGVHAWGVAPDGSWMMCVGQDTDTSRTGRHFYSYINTNECDSNITTDGVSTAASMHGTNYGLGGMGGYSNHGLGQWDSTGGASDYNKVEFEFPIYISSDNMPINKNINFGLYNYLEVFSDAGLFGTLDAEPYRHGAISITAGDALATFIGSLQTWKIDFTGSADISVNEIRYLDSDRFSETGGPSLDTTTTDEARSWNFLSGDDIMKVVDGRVEVISPGVKTSTLHMSGSASTTFFGDYG